MSIIPLECSFYTQTRYKTHSTHISVFGEKNKISLKWIVNYSIYIQIRYSVNRCFQIFPIFFPSIIFFRLDFNLIFFLNDSFLTCSIEYSTVMLLFKVILIFFSKTIKEIIFLSKIKFPILQHIRWFNQITYIGKLLRIVILGK